MESSMSTCSFLLAYVPPLVFSIYSQKHYIGFLTLSTNGTLLIISTISYSFSPPVLISHPFQRNSTESSYNLVHPPGEIMSTFEHPTKRSAESINIAHSLRLSKRLRT